MVKKTWTALDGCLVFDFTINRDPRDGIPSVAHVRCKAGSADEQVLTIHESRPTQFNLRFRSGCYAHGWMQQRAHVHIDGVDSTGIAADMRFGLTGQFDETHFEGLMVACPSRSSPAPYPPPLPPVPPPPFPLPPDDPGEPGSPVPFIAGQTGELFPYVYVRRWPRVSSTDLQYGFIAYLGASPPDCAFYDDLVAAAHQGRAQAEALALAFIDGVPPYAGQFVADPQALDGPLRDFAPLALQMQRQAPRAQAWLDALRERLDALLLRYGVGADYFASPGYLTQLDRVWQSWFALVVTLGYNAALRDELSLMLWTAHAVSQATVAVPASSPPASPPTGDSPAGVQMNALTPAQVTGLAAATVVLPAAVFPLPPATGGLGGSPPHGAPAGWIEPYAIGDLQLVRQRLLRYAPGEVARIENVMRGERREVTSRRTHRQLDTHSLQADDAQLLQNDDADERTSLLEETRKAVAEKSVSNQYNNFQTTYGPPTQATLNGAWTRTTQPGADPGVEDVTRFAREILNKTVNRITRKVGTARTSSTMNQSEDTVSSVIDNTGGSDNLRAVYRWLNKVYEACVVNYGSRLMMEFMVPHPAAHYIAQQSALAGQRLVRPLPPARLGVHTFDDIQPGNYARLGAAYGVTGLQPPPQDNRFVAASLRAGEQKQLAVPAGCCAVAAFAAAISAPAGTPAPQVLVGCQQVPLDAGAQGTALQPFGDDSTIPVSVIDAGPTLSPPSDPQVLVNVQVQCQPTRRAMDEWRIATYAAVMAAYEQQLARYQAEAGGGGAQAARSPLANRRIEQRELRGACLRLLLARAATLTGAPAAEGDWAAGSPPGPSPWVVNEPRYLQFLDQALEWSEMAYSLHAGPHGLLQGTEADAAALGAGDDALFTAWLQADQARVLLPVQPRCVMAFLYFLCAGLVWDGTDRLVPALQDDVPLVNDLKHAGTRAQREERVGPVWQVVVPTSMQVLDEPAAAGAADRTVTAALPPDGEASWT